MRGGDGRRDEEKRNNKKYWNNILQNKKNKLKTGREIKEEMGKKVQEKKEIKVLFMCKQKTIICMFSIILKTEHLK